MKKVYCGDCKFFKIWRGNHGGYGEDCTVIGERESNYRHQWYIYPEPIVKNQKNNCKDYKRKWWKIGTNKELLRGGGYQGNQ